MAIHNFGGHEKLSVTDVLHPLERRDHLFGDLDEQHSVASRSLIIVEWPVGEPDATPHTISQKRPNAIAEALR